jgi:hypothetical protein
MSALNQRIVDVVRRAGRGGISGTDLFAIVYDGQLHYRQHEARGRSALKAHIWQINQPNRIIIGSRQPGGWYWINNKIC